jgi:hypothetical protein
MWIVYESSDKNGQRFGILALIGLNI